MRKLSRFILALAFLGLLGVGGYADKSRDSKADFGVIENVFSLVRSEFIKELPPSKIVEGTLKNLDELLRKEGVSYSIPVVPKDMSQEEAGVFLDSQYKKIGAANPKLLKEHKLAHQVIDAMIKSLGDRYTVFMDPEEFQNLKESMSGGNFGGVGIYIELDKNNANRLTVAKPIPDSPAWEAGVKEKDVIIAIDGVSTAGFTINDAQEKLRGAVGSPVVLTLRRVGQQKPFDVTLHRDVIHVNSVAAQIETIDGHKFGYIKLQMFGEKTDEELEGAIRQLENEGAQGYILDLRNNGGGYIVTAVDVVSKFVATGSVVTSVEERGAGNKVYRSRPSLREAKPLILLINQYSASASEITAAALSDYKVAELIGVKSFGKGSVQKIFSLPDGSGVKITTAHYHTPTGKDINEVGIEPQEKVDFDGTSFGGSDDAQYQAATKALLVKLKAKQLVLDKHKLPLARTGAEQWRYLRSLNRGEPQVVTRRYVVNKDSYPLLEEVKVRFPGSSEPEVFWFDLGPALGIAG